MHRVSDLRATGVWPKSVPEFTDEEQRVRDAFVRRWHELLPVRGRIVERFSHATRFEARSRRGAPSTSVQGWASTFGST
jgi:hypothetical protein